MPFSLRFHHLCLLLIAGATGGACTPTYTVPEQVKPLDPVQEFALELPPNLEVRHVDFSATEYTTDSSVLRGRGFLKVYAVDRQSGESVLLIFEDIMNRKQPLQVIRFRNVVRGNEN